MAFFDTLETITNNIGEKANNAMEISKYNNKISSENKSIIAIKKEIANYCWEQYQHGKSLDPKISEFCEKISSHTQEIERLKKEIEQIKKDTPPIIPKKVDPTCPKCGTVLEKGMNFCGICGADLTPKESDPIVIDAEIVPAGEAPSFCPKCGAKAIGEKNFCAKCGAKL